MKVSVDQEVCIGCGLCPSIAPDLFEMRDDGKAYTIVEDVPGELEDDAKDSAESCPTNAIEAK